MSFLQNDEFMELGKVKIDIEDKLVPKGGEITALPAQGKSPEWILEEMAKMDKELGTHTDWRQGKISGAVYHGGDDLSKVLLAAFERYAVSNSLHPDVFPSIREMEAEIVAMCLRMYNNPDGATRVTSGGTESIVMAIKAYRDWARDVKGITEPEMIGPVTAHAAFDNGAAYMSMRYPSIPWRTTRTRAACAEPCSAINFPDGNQDDIVALGGLAARYNIGLHVDCCLGSFIAPFLEQAGLADGENGRYKLMPFDFRVRWVTSISQDTHKYGFAPKVPIRHSTLNGPGALIAEPWAAMQYMGYDPPLTAATSVTSSPVRNNITTSIPELYVLGSPPASVVAFGSQDKSVNV
ncbi:PLP-dependent transferase [Imleria badia]|nr:PLP-dependent transferase [Imleria badia]